MPTLNFPTNGPTGRDIVFSNWKEYSRTIGFFHNLNHHKYTSTGRNPDSCIHITIEANDEHGAYAKEGRIVTFEPLTLNNLQNYFPTLYRASTNPTGNQTARINRNELVYSLIRLYNFTSIRRNTNTTRDVIPPIINDVSSYANNLSLLYPNMIIEKDFLEGYNLSRFL